MWKRSFFLFLSIFTGAKLILELLKDSQEDTINTSDEDGNAEDSFIHVSSNLSVFSAFYDDITEKGKLFIRIVAIDTTEKEWVPSLKCRFYDTDRIQYMESVEAIKVNSKDLFLSKTNINLAFFLCPCFGGNSTENHRFPLPRFVHLGDNQEGKNDKPLLRIHYPPKQPPKYKVALCVQPLHFPTVKKPLALLEWIEYNFLLGVEHITFYNHNVSKEVLSLLKTYEEEGVVRVLNWSVPLPFVHGLPWAQWVAASDCSHRYRGTAKYVIAMDTDEFLVPSRSYDTFPDYFESLWNNLDASDTKNISFIQFRSKVGFDNWPSGFYPTDFKDKNFENLANSLKILTKTAVFEAGQEKFVMRPDLIIESGVHWPILTVNGSVSRKVAMDDAFYLHFRHCDEYCSKPNGVLLHNATCIRTEGVVQELSAAKRFGKRLVDRIYSKVVGSNVLQNMFLSF